MNDRNTSKFAGLCVALVVIYRLLAVRARASLYPRPCPTVEPEADSDRFSTYSAVAGLDVESYFALEGDSCNLESILCFYVIQTCWIYTDKTANDLLEGLFSRYWREMRAARRLRLARQLTHKTRASPIHKSIAHPKFHRGRKKGR
jgi:hypothetical protein